VAGEFVPLADLLRAPRGGDAPGAASAVSSAAGDRGTGAVGVAHVPPDVIAEFGVDVAAQLDAGVVAAVREARLFRARLADAFDDAAARLLRELATDVLARELRLAPCDLAAIVRGIGERAPVVRVRIAACDAAALAGGPLLRGCDAAVVEDPALAGGDAIVELAGGALDARLGVRLATILEGFA
jgi:hypothetical protein